MSPAAINPLDRAVGIYKKHDKSFPNASPQAMYERLDQQQPVREEEEDVNNNGHVALEMPIATYQRSPPNNHIPSDQGAGNEAEVDTDSTRSTCAIQLGQFLQKLGIFTIFFATLILPFVKTIGAVSMVLYDISADDHCNGNACNHAINQTGSSTYLVMIFGFASAAFGHFLVGCYMFAKTPILANSLVIPMQLFSVFTGMEILIMTITFPTIHVNAGMAVGCFFSIVIEFLAMSTVFCYSIGEEAPNPRSGSSPAQVPPTSGAARAK